MPNLPPEPNSTRKLRILVVDDDPGMLETLADILSVTGYTVEAAGSGEEALEKAAANPPDCVLMDVRMPGLNGLETFRRIKPLAPDSFVVLMTAYSSTNILDEARAEGALEVVPKPLDLESLLALIQETSSKTPVLVVDDDLDFCGSLGDALSTYPFDVSMASTVQEALESFRREPRRVVVLDMKLNGASGLDVFRQLREINPRAPVILISAFSELDSQMNRGLTMSASYKFKKPFEIDQLASAIQQVELARSEQRAVL